MKLLIVEDSQPVRDRLHSLFSEMQGLETVVAANLEQAVASFRQLAPEVVLADIQLPDGSGLDLLGIVKRERPHTRVLMISNHAFYRKRCLAEGADHFFDKSMDLEAMATTVRTLSEAANEG